MTPMICSVAALVQEWHCAMVCGDPSVATGGAEDGEAGSGLRMNKDDVSSGRFVVAVSPVFSAVSIDVDPEFNAIHQRRADAQVCAQI